jgi:hypothetical protein
VKRRGENACSTRECWGRAPFGYHEARRAAARAIRAGVRCVETRRAEMRASLVRRGLSGVLAFWRLVLGAAKAARAAWRELRRWIASAPSLDSVLESDVEFAALDAACAQALLRALADAFAHRDVREVIVDFDFADVAGAEAAGFAGQCA